MAEHNELGATGEELARHHVTSLGLEILETNWRNGKLEIDIIAKDKNSLVLIEVKTRNTDFFGPPESFVDKKKQNMMAEAAEIYLNNLKDTNMEVRYDIVAVLVNPKGGYEIKYFEDAFFPDDLGLSVMDF